MTTLAVFKYPFNPGPEYLGSACPETAYGGRGV